MNAESARRWRAKHRDYVRANDSARKKLSRLTDPAFKAKTDERTRQWAINNPERSKERSRQWNIENAERKRFNDAAWAAAHPERRREIERRYTAAHPDKMRAKNHARQARLNNAPGSFTADQFDDLCEAHGHRCVYCGEQTTMTVDHNVPLIRGGSNYIENILPACKSCNSSKGARTADEFMAARAA